MCFQLLIDQFVCWFYYYLCMGYILCIVRFKIWLVWWVWKFKIRFLRFYLRVYLYINDNKVNRQIDLLIIESILIIFRLRKQSFFIILFRVSEICWIEGDFWFCKYFFILLLVCWIRDIFLLMFFWSDRNFLFRILYGIQE